MISENELEGYERVVSDRLYDGTYIKRIVLKLVAEVRKMNKKYALLLEQGREDQEHAVDLRLEADWLASQCVSLYGNICSTVSACDYINDPEMNVDYWLEEARRAVKDASS